MFGWKDRISVIIASAVYLQSLQNSSDGEVDRHGWHDRTIFKSRGRSFSVSKWTKGIVSRAKKKKNLSSNYAIIPSSAACSNAQFLIFVSDANNKNRKKTKQRPKHTQDKTSILPWRKSSAPEENKKEEKNKLHFDCWHSILRSLSLSLSCPVSFSFFSNQNR